MIHRPKLLTTISHFKVFTVNIVLCFIDYGIDKKKEKICYKKRSNRNNKNVAIKCARIKMSYLLFFFLLLRNFLL